MTMVAMPALDTGMMTDERMRVKDAPSMRAASSRLSGTLSKLLLSTKVL